MFIVLAFHHCVPLSNIGPSVVCGLSLMLVLVVVALRCFSGFSGVRFRKTKPFTLDRESEGHRFVSLKGPFTQDILKTFLLSRSPIAIFLASAN